MKVCVFGADGQTGEHVVNELLSRGHKLIAFVYKNEGKRKETVEYIKGDVLNLDDVKRAVEKSEAVISVIGHIKNSNPRLQTQGISNIVLAMKENNISRIISLTGTGVRNKNDKPSIIDIILNFIIKKIDSDRIADGIEHAETLKSSGLDWTIIRVLKLTNSKSNSEKYNLTLGGPVELFTSRKKVAKIMCDMLEDKQYNKLMPVVS